MTSLVRVAAVGVCGAVGAALVAVFVYNSGYGHDALEYLVIGRSLGEGYRLYDFVPSKSWALYAVTAGFLALPRTAGHAGITALVLVLLAASVGTTYAVVGTRFGRRAAVMASALVLLASAFMELNYYQPEPFVFIAGLLAYGGVTPRRRGEPIRATRAGMLLGAGMAFKVVAGFYAVGLAVWLAVGRRGDSVEGDAPGWRWRPVLGVGAGLGAAVLVPALYFAATGRLGEHVQWTYAYPLLEYPANTYWLAKLYTKLLWVWIALGSGVAIWMSSGRVRRELRADLMPLCAMGVAGLWPLVRTQASHYAFPGAALLLVCTAVVWDRWLAGRPHGPRNQSIYAVVLGAVCVVSGVLYRPEAVGRLARPTTWPAEQQLREVVQGLVKPEQSVLALGQGTKLYWLTNRYPNWPVVNTQVQTRQVIAEQADSLLKALDDPRLALVEFDPERPSFDDPDFLSDPDAQRFLAEFTSRLERRFVLQTSPLTSLVLWVRTDPTDPPGS